MCFLFDLTWRPGAENFTQGIIKLLAVTEKRRRASARNRWGDLPPTPQCACYHCFTRSVGPDSAVWGLLPMPPSLLCASEWSSVTAVGGLPMVPQNTRVLPLLEQPLPTSTTSAAAAYRETRLGLYRHPRVHSGRHTIHKSAVKPDVIQPFRENASRKSRFLPV